MSDTSNTPDIAFQSGALGNGVLNTLFPPGAQGRTVGQFLYLYDKDRLLIDVNINGTMQWKELLVLPPRGSALGADESIGSATVLNGTNEIVVNNALATANSVILVQAIGTGIHAAAPVQAVVTNQGAGVFRISIYDFAGALTNVTADVTFRFLIL